MVLSWFKPATEVTTGGRDMNEAWANEPLFNLTWTADYTNLIVTCSVSLVPSVTQRPPVHGCREMTSRDNGLSLLICVDSLGTIKVTCT